MNVAIIQARMGSTRLPGKTLANLAGRPMIAHVVDQLRQVSELHSIVVAIPYCDVSTGVPKWCIDNDVDWRCGPEDCVLTRIERIARHKYADVIVRVCGDTPCLLPWTISAAINEVAVEGYDFAHYVDRDGKPLVGTKCGQTCEVFSMDAISRAARQPTREAVEHVTWDMVRSNDYRRSYLFDDAIDTDLNLAVDTLDDLRRVGEYINATVTQH